MWELREFKTKNQIRRGLRRLASLNLSQNAYGLSGYSANGSPGRLQAQFWLRTTVYRPTLS